MESERYLKATGWGPFRMPGERRRWEDAYKRACEMLDHVAAVPQDAEEDVTTRSDPTRDPSMDNPHSSLAIEAKGQLAEHQYPQREIGQMQPAPQGPRPQPGSPPSKPPAGVYPQSRPQGPARVSGHHDMGAKFEIYEDAKGDFRFRLRAGNGEVVATGESYKTKAGVINGVDAVKRAATEAMIDDKADVRDPQ